MSNPAELLKDYFIDLRIRDNGCIFIVPELNLVAAGGDANTALIALAEKFVSLYEEFRAADALDDFPQPQRRRIATSPGAARAAAAVPGTAVQLQSSLTPFFIKYLIVLATIVVLGLAGAKFGAAAAGDIASRVIAQISDAAHRALAVEVPHREAVVARLDQLAAQSELLTPERAEQLRSDLHKIVQPLVPLTAELNPLYNALTHPPEAQGSPAPASIPGPRPASR